MEKQMFYQRIFYLGLASAIAGSAVIFLLSSRAEAATKINDAGNPGAMLDAGRQVVRTSSGTLYAVMNVAGDCQVWKSTDGTSWSEPNTAGPACSATLRGIAVAIDSSDILHIAYVDTSVDTQISYITYTTSTDSFGTAAVAASATGEGLDIPAIAVDSNNIPHIALFLDAAAGAAQYTNRVGGSWKAEVNVETGLVALGLKMMSIVISEDNIPEISYINSGAAPDQLTAAVGNVNDAASFTVQDIDTSINETAGTLGTSIAIDSGGNTYVAYIDGTNNDVTLIRHNDADAWSTWQTATNSGTDGKEPSIAINGTDVYVFYSDAGSDVAYDKYTGTWAGTVVLQTGTYQDVKAKWSFNHNNQGSTQIDYLFSDGTDVYWDKLTLQSAPGAPTLSVPADTATLVPTTGNTFQAAATDPESDTIKYHIKIFNGTSQSGGNCSGTTFEEQDQNVAQGGWSQAGAYASGATATYTHQTAFTRGNFYCWQVRGKDPTGSNTFGNWSTPRTFTVNSIPATPTLINPSSSQTAISTLPQFQLRTTDADSDYLRYHIKVYTTQTECNNDSGTNLVRSIDQTASQTGWQNQDLQSSTAYSSSSIIGSSTIALHVYQPAPLSPNTAYWWKARAIDPGGTNTFSSWAACITFTTATSEVQIQGGTEIRGGTIIQ